MAHDIFISHAHADKAVADLVCATLEQRGVRCWMAPRDIRPGADWGSAIVGAIRESRAMVLVFSDAANASRHIPRELERAIDLEIPIVPFRIDNVLPRGSLEYNLALVHWLDASSPPLEAHARRLADVVTTMLGTPEVRATPHGAPVVERPVVDQPIVDRPVVLEPVVQQVASPDEDTRAYPLPRTITSSNRTVWVIIAALGAAAVLFAVNVTRRDATEMEGSAAADMSQVAAARNAPAAMVGAPLPTAAAPNTAAADPNASTDADSESWNRCNGTDQAAVIAGCTAVIQAKGNDKEKLGRAYSARGAAYYLRADFDTAIADYSKSLELGFALPYTYSNRGLAYAAKNDYTRALADYDLAIQANPAFVDAYRNRALANAVNRRFQAAIADLSTAVGIDPDHADLRLARAIVYLLQHDSERSLADIAIYVTQKPDDAAGYRVRGLGYFQRGLMVLAKQDFARCLKLDPSDAQALYAQGTAREMGGDSSGKDDVSAALKIDPTLAELMTAFGVIRK